MKYSTQVKDGIFRLEPFPESESEVEKYYKNDKFYNTHSPLNWFEKVRKEHLDGLWDAMYDYQIDQLIGINRNIMDVGCGAGWFLAHALDPRHNVGRLVGIDPSEKAVKYSIVPALIYDDAKSIDNVENYPWNIRMSLVLEHVFNPIKFIEKYIPYMQGIGKMMIVVPNEFNTLQRKIAQREGNYFVSPVHLNYFTPDTLRYVIKRAFLNSGHNNILITETSTFPMEIFYFLGLNYIKNPEIGKKIHLLRLHLETKSNLMFDLYKIMYDLWGIGREIVFTVEIK